MRRSLSRQTNRGKVLWCGQRLSILSCRESNHHPSLDRNQGSQRKYCRFSAAPLFTEAEENFNIRLFGHTCSFGVTSTGGPVAPLLFIANVLKYQLLHSLYPCNFDLSTQALHRKRCSAAHDKFQSDKSRKALRVASAWYIGR